MAAFQELYNNFSRFDYFDLGHRQLEQIRDGLKIVTPEEIKTSDDGKKYIDLLRMFRKAVAENDKFHGANYPDLLNSILSVGENGVYSDSLRFIFELIQNVDDCDFLDNNDRRLDMQFDFESNRIILRYNEVGFTPFNVFAITGIAEAAKNVSENKIEIGEKGIGFKSVFGVADRVLIQSGWFSFELHKDNFTIPIPNYESDNYYTGTQMTLFVPGKAREIYTQIRNQYCHEDAIFGRNPLLFLNKLTYLKIYYDDFRRMEFRVSRSAINIEKDYCIEQEVELSVALNDHDSSKLDVNVPLKRIRCYRFTHYVKYSYSACKSRYGEGTMVGINGGKKMMLQVVVPYHDELTKVKNGMLYSFLPTRLGLNIPLAIHVPFKLDASREFVDPQSNNRWFQESCHYLTELMSFVYPELCKLVEKNIVYYIPSYYSSLFAENNGKEKCLSEQACFKGSAYLKMPLFKTIDNRFEVNDDVYCFDPNENITDYNLVHKLLGNKKSLFLLPDSIEIGIIKGLRIDVSRDINLRLLKTALSDESKTGAILDYLESVGFSYNESVLQNEGSLELSATQIEIIFKHRKLAALLQEKCCECVKARKIPAFSILSNDYKNLKDYLYTGFELDEVYSLIAGYIKNRNSYVCVLDIDEDQFMPCANALVISKRNPRFSFGEFCQKIDKRSTFAIRVKMSEASESLDRSINDESLSASDYLCDLRNIRIIVKESIGETGYRSYINLIQRSGTDKNRFIQEILQNADDCDYPLNKTPAFKLKQVNNTVITEYNETGFTRANIRAITSIGESTKTEILNGDTALIGEKGVGFKTVFSIASKINVYSGEFNFSMTADEPTIPRIIKAPSETVSGTRMEIVLKNRDAFPIYSEPDIVKLCLCLRNLKIIEIGARKVEIRDTDERRIISVDGKEYIFKKYVHDFEVNDEKAISERENEVFKVAHKQTIICYIPEKNVLKEYYLYVGLPTTHKINVPIAIDAPFMLTTSREHIETDCAAWNYIIRKELYTAVLSVMDLLKSEKRSDVFRYLNFVYRFHGNVRGYDNAFSNSEFINEYPLLAELRNRYLLPTLDKSVFAVPSLNSAKIYPEFVVCLFRELKADESAFLKLQNIIDLYEDDENISNVFKALNCPKATPEEVLPIIEEYAEDYISDEEFRTKLYSYLCRADIEFSDNFVNSLKELSIIPVFGRKNEAIQYVKWEDGKIYIKPGIHISDPDYYYLCERLLPKSDCEKIFKCNINVMSDDYRRSLFNQELINSIDKYWQIDLYRRNLYSRLLKEFNSKNLFNNGSFDFLMSRIDKIPLKNQLGELVSASQLFVCNEPEGYFESDIIKRASVDSECMELAQYLKCKELRDAYYDDLNINTALTDEDVEELKDGCFKNREEILRKAFIDGYASESVLSENGLEYLTISRSDEQDDDIGGFPEEPINNRQQLIEHVKKVLAFPVEIVSIIEPRTVQKWKNKFGEQFSIDSGEMRDVAVNRYTSCQKCFCQMCRKAKYHKYIEVNSIQSEPKYYYPQMRIALCLECSKNFEIIRNSNAEIINKFIRSIMDIQIRDEGAISVNFAYGESITFTAKHLAEIQEIIKASPYAQKRKKIEV